jgi:hypothetical protein
MSLPSPLDRAPVEDLRRALELIDRGGPFPAELVSTIRNLSVYKYAAIRAHERRRENGAIVTDIVSAELTDRGRSLLAELS